MASRLLLLLGVGVLLAVAGAAAPSQAAPTSGGSPPVLSVTVNADGSLHATWAVPAGEKMEEFLYDDPADYGGRLADVGTPIAPTYAGGSPGCARDTWCWPEQGVPLYCYFPVYQPDVAGDCPGHFDLGDTEDSYDTEPLQVGATYYVQVTSMDTCDAGCAYPDEYWSNVVTIVDNPPAKRGGGTTTTGKTTTTGGGTSGGTTAKGATAKVSFSQAVTVRHRDGTTETTTSATLVDGDTISSPGKPTKLTFAWGVVWLDAGAELEYAPYGLTLRWMVVKGQAYYSWASGQATEVGGYNAGLTAAAKPGSATISSTQGADVVRCYSGKTQVWPIGEKAKAIVLQPKQQVTVNARGIVGRPKRFVPTRQFWK